MYLIVPVISLIGYSSIVFAQPEDKILDVSDDLTLRNMVFELRSLVFDQSKRIMALERQNKIQSEELKELRTLIETQNAKILNLQLQHAYKNDVENTSKLMEPKPRNFHSKNTSIFGGPDISEKVMLTPTQQRIARAADSPIAFYAYASHAFSRPSDHFALNFDTIITNVGNSYHPHSGVFIAPRSGYYVFTWSFRVAGDAHISTELMVNGRPQGSVYFDATDYVGGNSSGTIVVQVNQGDEVFVRTTQDNFNRGDILSDYMGRTYFGGWLLH